MDDAELRAKIEAFIAEDLLPMGGGSSDCGSLCIRLGDVEFVLSSLRSILRGDYDPRNHRRSVT